MAPGPGRVLAGTPGAMPAAPENATMPHATANGSPPSAPTPPTPPPLPAEQPVRYVPVRENKPCPEPGPFKKAMPRE